MKLPTRCSPLLLLSLPLELLLSLGLLARQSAVFGQLGLVREHRDVLGRPGHVRHGPRHRVGRLRHRGGVAHTHSGGGRDHGRGRGFHWRRVCCSSRRGCGRCRRCGRWGARSQWRLGLLRFRAIVDLLDHRLKREVRTSVYTLIKSLSDLSGSQRNSK